MSKNENKQVMTKILSALADGDARPFLESLADDLCWTMSGHAPWSGTYRGKETVLNELFRPVNARLSPPYRLVTERIISEDDFVVVQVRGNGNKTKAGRAYDQQYCWVCRMERGQLKDVVEYADTHLVVSVLGEPDAASNSG